MLYFCRVQRVRGTLQTRIIELKGSLDLGLPLDPDEVRTIMHAEWQDLYSRNAENLQARITLIRQSEGLKSSIDERPIKDAVGALKALSRKWGL